MPETRSTGPVGLLSRVVMGVPDPDATAEYVRDALDFAVTHCLDGSWLVGCEGEYGGTGQGSLQLKHASETTLLDVVFAARDDFPAEAVAARLDGTRTEAGGVTVQDPSGIQVSVQPESSLLVERPAPSVLRPRRLGHLNVTTPDPTATADFYRTVLGLALSEQIGDDLYFLRTHTEHHNVGIRPGRRPGLHHLGFEVAGWHSYQPILDHLDALGYKAEYGPGRHRPGASLFTYVRDPSSGLRFELFADMSHINTGPDTPPIRWTAEQRMTTTINCWGPTPPESFLT
ncbi:VOC family protein [Streptomyces sp. NPDC057199]|uniref:VOC family protein n=1 Tax=Streptomyces sp. NPDC057199 TaxID=3346047 RepID=UPI0036299937